MSRTSNGNGTVTAPKLSTLPTVDLTPVAAPEKVTAPEPVTVTVPEPSYTPDDYGTAVKSGKAFAFDIDYPPFIPEKVTVMRSVTVDGVTSEPKETKINKVDSDGNVVLSTERYDRKSMHRMIAAAIVRLSENDMVTYTWTESGHTFTRECRIVSYVKAPDAQPQNMRVTLSLRMKDGTRYNHPTQVRYIKAIAFKG